MNPSVSPSPLESIMYISLPDDAEREIGDLVVDPDILIPVEIVGADESWTMQNLSWEMIIAAMLKVLVYDPENIHANYYRDFVVAARPHIVEELSKTGIEQAQKKSYDAAEELFSALRAILPADPNPALNLALVYEEHATTYEQAQRSDLVEKYREAAFSLYAELARLFPDNSDVRFYAGHFCVHVGNYDNARKHFDRFLELSEDPEKNERVTLLLEEIDKQASSDRLFREAYDFINLGQEHEGIARIREFLQAQPDVWNAWFLLGWAHRRLEEYRLAAEAFERAINLGSAEADTFNELAICQMELKRYAECEKTLKTALRTSPRNTKIISNLGILSIKTEKLQDAMGYFRSVLEYDPDDEIAKNYLEFLANE